MRIIRQFLLCAVFLVPNISVADDAGEVAADKSIGPVNLAAPRWAASNSGPMNCSFETGEFSGIHSPATTACWMSRISVAPGEHSTNAARRLTTSSAAKNCRLFQARWSF